jgi:hypothetical protein
MQTKIFNLVFRAMGILLLVLVAINLLEALLILFQYNQIMSK